ncbi:Kelch repeat-containing protein [Permianibacter aggregans]|uniref:Kelch motif protein n=1 Tax=Permianibacter aggregans TaxID=1510150 RepID=A0A4R6V3F6_9GAMM|nr:galactose oxidase [Permianibacter aggregans]QGX38875.1 galactose oxidase [Permianibacter aggregans]TDQ50684.1 Kelch motif protein [Permianibacter aggregans]
MSYLARWALVWALCCGAPSFAAEPLNQSALPPVPQPLANNAVARLDIAGRYRLYSFMGLGPGKAAEDISRAAYELDADTGRWHVLPPVPGPSRLASVAAGAGRYLYLFGGYTVAGNGEEVSTPEVWRFDPLQRRYDPMPPMPKPVDDSVALVWRERHILLISGWHNDGNVSDVQWFDTGAERWSKATAFPGKAVFGHAGGLLDDHMLICGGVYVAGVEQGRRQYRLSDECWLGYLNENVLGDIQWRPIKAPSSAFRYRAAATGTRLRGRHIVFAGGTQRPYNYNGIGYDGVPAEPVAEVMAFNLHNQTWENWGTLPTPTMDHRGLMELNGGLVTIGGMESGQKVTPVVRRFIPPTRR